MGSLENYAGGPPIRDKLDWMWIEMLPECLRDVHLNLATASLFTHLTYSRCPGGQRTLCLLSKLVKTGQIQLFESFSTMEQAAIDALGALGVNTLPVIHMHIALVGISFNIPRLLYGSLIFLAPGIGP